MRTRYFTACRRIVRRLRLDDNRAAQIVEFAVSLPLLVLFVVGIFDFSGAFTLKQKLTNIARDAARTAAAGPANDLSSSQPVSVVDAFHVIDEYFKANNLLDCGITLSSSPNKLKWKSTANGNGCPSPGLTIIINRAYYFPITGATLPPSDCDAQAPGPQQALIGTCVSIKYAYDWRFGRVASVLGQSAALPPSIPAIGVALNEN